MFERQTAFLNSCPLLMSALSLFVQSYRSVIIPFNYLTSLIIDKYKTTENDEQKGIWKEASMIGL
jgi:hypothetical protein